MNYIALPDLIALAWMAVVLARLQRWRANDVIHLWITGLVLIVVEGIARFYYQSTVQPVLHKITHVIALDAYFLAGVAFFQSAGGKLRFLHSTKICLTLCAAPHIALLTLYGSGVHIRGLYAGFAFVGLLAGLIGAFVFKRHWVHYVCHLLIWLPILLFASQGSFRTVAYLSLFFAYLATAIAFFLTLPSERRGRAVVVTCFLVWSLCFVTHPWVAESHHEWVLMAEKIWDLQKFFVIFGLLIVSLEEYGATNEYQALHDILTGLPNRRLFEDRLEQAIARANRNRSRILLFNMDMDDFKQVNDTLGHEVGDELLRQVGKRLLAVSRETDTLARMGGDEFYLLINDMNVPSEALALERIKDQAYKMVDQFRKAVEDTPYVLAVGIETHELRVRVSIGCVAFPDEAGDVTELCRVADQRMYLDKKRNSPSLELAAH